jgi:exodeoxyribonuclease VII small subunit
MSDEPHSFSTARVRLDEIVSQVRKKDTSLEKSLDLLEEGVRLANACTELIDQTDWVSGSEQSPVEMTDAPATAADGAAADSGDAPGAPEATTAPISESATDIVDPAEGEVADSGVEPVADADSEDFGDADEAWADEDSSDGDDGPGAR